MKEALQKVKQCKSKLEQDLYIAIERLLADFKGETDIYPSAINVDVFDVSGFNDKEKRYVLGRVTVSVAI